ncbi:hypothetical protein FBQ87_08060 [Sphingobacteriales bacterium CHB3]|nr:hypothetical protein [Sphingobacteriales bacterium CHB3]
MATLFVRAFVLIIALILVTGITAFAQESQSRPAFIGLVKFNDGSPAPDATRVWAVKGTCSSDPYNHCCSPPTCPQAGQYYIDSQDPGLCEYGTYTVYAFYDNTGQGWSCSGSTVVTWDAQNDPATANITMNPCQDY